MNPGWPFSLLIKPASADCNLRCSYCFYLDHSRLYPHSRRHRMDETVLERVVASYMQTEQSQYSFGWQGGEPTLMGLDFFRKVVALQKKHGKQGALVGNGLQTNATLVTDELAAFLSEYKFLLGVSLDGPQEIHDLYRRGDGERGSFDRVLKGIEILQRHSVEFNILTAVNSANVRRAGDVYHFLLDRGFLFHQYIPIVEFDDQGQPLPFSIGGDEWGEFLCLLFDEWVRSDVERVSIRLFDAVLSYLVEGKRVMCTMAEDCRQYFVVEYNGDVYPCDFFVEVDRRLGNILEDEWTGLQRSDRYKAFGRQKQAWNALCEDCPHLMICAGDCLKHRFCGPQERKDPKTLSWLCAGWKRFYDHAMPGFRRLARSIQRQRRREGALRGGPGGRQTAPPQAPPIQPPPGRNDPCPCGSGRKYKHCHGRRPTQMQHCHGL